MTPSCKIGIATAITAAMSANASADPRIRLESDATVCDPAPLRARIGELLGRNVFVDDDGAVDVAVQFTVERDADGLRGTIEIVEGEEGTDGRRVIPAADCSALDEAAAFALALVLSQPRADAASAGPLANSEAPEPVPDPAPDDSPPSPPPSISARSTPPLAAVAPPGVADLEARPGIGHPLGGFETSAGVVGGLASGGAQAGVVVGAALRRGRASVGLDFSLTAADSVAVGSGRVLVRTGAFEAVGCFHRGSLAGCATAAVGWVHGQGQDLINPSTASTPYVATGARVAWDAAISPRIAVRFQLAARVPLTRNRFLVDEMPVWATSPIEAWLGIGLVARIP